MTKSREFEKELTDLLQKYNKPAESNTPAYFLAKYLKRCLQAWNEATYRRDKWYKAKKFNVDSELD